MANIKNKDQSQIEFLQVNYKEQLLPGTFEHTLNYLIDEKIDMSAFDRRYKNKETGVPSDRELMQTTNEGGMLEKNTSLPKMILHFIKKIITTPVQIKRN